MAHTTDYGNTSAGKKRKAKRVAKKTIKKVAKRKNK